MRRKQQQPWEAIGMSRATWYRLGKPTQKPDRKAPLREMAEAFGVSMRTIQRDRVRAIREAVQAEVRKADAEGRKPDQKAIDEHWLVLLATTFEQREARIRKAVEDGLERLQRLATIR